MTFSRRGARLVNPLVGLRIGEQLHWYKVHASSAAPGPPRSLRARSPGPMLPTASAETWPDSPEVAVLSTTRLAPFTYRWPADTESFDRGWDMSVRSGGEAHRVRHGIGHRVVYGRDRVHAVTWVDGQPMVEGVAADDYDDTASLVSVLRVGAKHLVRTPAQIPAGYAGFDIVDHASEVVAPYTRHALAVKLAADDLVGWARHALLRTGSKLGSAQGAASLVAPAAEALQAGLTRPISTDRRAVAEALLAYGATNPILPGDVDPVFSPNPDANYLMVHDAFAFLLAVIFDQGILAERAWTAPYLLRERLGHLEPRRIAAEPERVAAAIRTAPKLHRYMEKMPAWIVSAARRVIRDYGGEAGRIWGDTPSAVELQRRLDAFDGIGQKKAAMAVEILARDLRTPITDLAGSDIAYDVHVRRVFLRTGLAEKDDVDHMVLVARAVHPDRPGELDLPSWMIGRRWCRPGVPLCPECPISQACPKLVDMAAGVVGA